MKKGKVTNVAVVGVGLIGGSLGMALRKAKGYRVTGIGRDKKKLTIARRRGAVDAYYTDMAAGVREADIVVLCTPVDCIVPMVQSLLPYLKPGAVITDAGSVKGVITKGIDALLLSLPKDKRPAFIGGHPMAGLEKNGVQAAIAELYRGATVVLTPSRTTGAKAAGKIKKLWKDAGAGVITMPADEHDRLVAYISHLPHLIAFTLCSAVPRHSAAGRLAAGSFKDMTRVADSDPESWAAICSGNRPAIVKALNVFVAQLKATAAFLENPGKLKNTFAKARTARQKLVRTGRA